jgi:hypothetical protein
MKSISAACVFALLTAHSVNAGVAERSKSPAPLNDLAVGDGKQCFGVAVDTDEMNNATYAVNLRDKHLFGMPDIVF